MDKKIHSGIMLTLLLMGMLTLAFNIQSVESDWIWTETIYIRADGSVDPDTAPVSTLDSITYTLTDNIVGDVPVDSSAIVVERDYIVINGAGYTVQGTKSDFSKGVSLSHVNNVIIKNTNIKDFGYGICLEYSVDIIMLANNITLCSAYGIRLYSSSNNSIFGNNVLNNDIGIFIYYSSDYNSIVENNITENDWSGIGLSDALKNNVSRNNITKNHYGVSFDSSSNCNIASENKLRKNIIGILLDSSSDNKIAGNSITDNEFGIWLWFSSNHNAVVGNSIRDNTNQGIHLEGSSNNKLYHNNIVNNVHQVYSAAPTNIWDDGYSSGGNYWSDYEERYPDATEIDDSGIWDTPYVIDENNQDNYPLMEPWTPTPPIPTTIDELKTEIEELDSEGEIDNQGIVTSLFAKLDLAQKLVDDGKMDQAKNILNSFINEVQAQSGKHITPEAAELLIKSAEHIISHLQD